MNNIFLNRVDESGHLSIEGYMHFAGLYDELGNLEKKFCFILISPRDVGKSTGLWKYTINNYWETSNWKNKLLYCRNNTSKTKGFIHSFNTSFSDLGLRMDNEKITKINLDTQKRADNITVGTVLPISVSENFKSAFSDNYNLLFWDEFNEFDNSDILNFVALKNQNDAYLNFIDTIKTFERHRDEEFRIFLLGNKVSPQNDLLLNLDISPNPDSEDDELFIRDIDGFKIRIVIASDKTFEKIKNHKKTLANALATYNERTDRYINKGGWLIEPENDIISFNSIYQSTKPLYNIIYMNCVFEFGEYEDDTYYISQISKNSYLRNIPLYSMDRISSLSFKESILYNEDDKNSLAEFLETIYKNNQLYFCSKFAKAFIIDFIIKNIERVF